jgi:hypothetical protein
VSASDFCFYFQHYASALPTFIASLGVSADTLSSDVHAGGRFLLSDELALMNDDARLTFLLRACLVASQPRWANEKWWHVDPGLEKRVCASIILTPASIVTPTSSGHRNEHTDAAQGHLPAWRRSFLTLFTPLDTLEDMEFESTV